MGVTNRTHSTRPRSRLYSDIPRPDAPVIYAGAFPILTTWPSRRSIYNSSLSLGLVVWPRFDDPFASQNPGEFCAFHFPGGILQTNVENSHSSGKMKHQSRPSFAKLTLILQKTRIVTIELTRKDLLISENMHRIKKKKKTNSDTSKGYRTSILIFVVIITLFLWSMSMLTVLVIESCVSKK